MTRRRRTNRFTGWACALTLAGALGLAHRADAAVIVTGQSGGTQLGQACTSGGNTAGWKFTVGSTDLMATSLGEYDQNGDGLGMSVEVGVWDSTGTLLGMVTVPSGTGPPLIGSFRYQALGSSFVLQSLQTYTIGSRCTGISGGGGYAPLDGPSFTFSSDFSAAGGRYNNGGLSTTFSEPTMNLGGSIFLGPNLEYDLLLTATPTETPTQTPTATGTATATETRTATATPTPAANGDGCQSGTQCLSTFCVDGVCCDTACTGLNQSCAVPLNVGTCSQLPAAPAPTMSPIGLLIGVGLLLAVSAAAMVRGRR